MPVPYAPTPFIRHDNGVMNAHGPYLVLPSTNTSLMVSPKSSSSGTEPIQYLFFIPTSYLANHLHSCHLLALPIRDPWHFGLAREYALLLPHVDRYKRGK